MVYIFGIIIGLIIGIILPYRIPAQYSTYVAVAILAAVDSVLGGIVANKENRFNMKVFISGFFGNAVLAAGFAFVGDRLGLQLLYLAPVFAFGQRIFNNFAVLRRYFIDDKKNDKE